VAEIPPPPFPCTDTLSVCLWLSAVGSIERFPLIPTRHGASSGPRKFQLPGKKGESEQKAALLAQRRLSPLLAAFTLQIKKSVWHAISFQSRALLSRSARGLLLNDAGLKRAVVTVTKGLLAMTVSR